MPNTGNTGPNPGDSNSVVTTQTPVVEVFGTPSGTNPVPRWNAATQRFEWLNADGTYAPLAGPTTAGSKFGIGASADARQPIALAATVNGPAALAGNLTLDKVGLAQAVTVTGDFTGDTGVDPAVLWGQNVFLTTGSAAGDGNGVSTLVGSLIEANVQTPAGTTFAVVRGLEAQAAFFGATAGATVTQMESMRVSAPVRKNGATAGTATNVYGLLVEAVTAGAVGATGSVFSLFVAGGVSRFGGRVDVNNTIANNGGSDLSIFAGFSTADGGSLVLLTAADGGHVRAQLTQAGSKFQVHDGTNVLFAVARGGTAEFSGGGSGGSFAAVQKLGFGTTTTDYPQFVATSHNAGAADGNKVALYTSDGTQAGAFPTNAILGLAVMNRSVALGGADATTANFGSGNGVVAIKDAANAPTTNATGGGVLYSQAGALKWRGSSGTVTTVAVA